jgi:hypothetical protein
MVAIRELCQRCLWFEGGRLQKNGTAAEVVTAYSQIDKVSADKSISEQNVKGDGRMHLIAYRVTNASGEIYPVPVTNENIHIEIELDILQEIRHPACGVSIKNQQGILITCINTVEMGTTLNPFPTGRIKLRISLEQTPYLPGIYHVTFWVMNPQGHIYLWVEDAILFEIGQSPIYGTSQIDYRWGCVYTKIEFASTVQPRALTYEKITE